MKFFASLLLISALAGGAIAQERLWFMFFTKGTGTRPPQAELQKMQQEHIANLVRLHGEKKLLMAGPLQDPTTVRRGIGALWLPDMESLKQCFANDPYVTNGIMNVEAFPWAADKSKINLQIPDPNKITENRLLILTASRDIPAYLLKEHRQVLAASYKPAIDGEFEGGKFTELLMFKGASETQIRAAMQRDPLVRLGWVKAELMPLWMADGVLK